MTKYKKTIFLLIIYTTFVLILTLAPYKESVKFDDSYNLTLFKSINNYVKHMQNFGIINLEAFRYLPFEVIRFANSVFTVSFKNILGNLVLFLPLGFLTSFLIKSKKLISVFTYSLLFSTLIEVMQYIFLTSRRADVDDVILNTVGGVLGYLIYKIGGKTS
ncbi:VanZ family protein [Alkalibaculum bacchi]|uniref:VanZ family protein n=1 Tax=Alkalibaculum bacchi TaxID=645887 RepID=UPI0026F112ED|nr:VanZ family protein [Alkalibaculum bacchi]